MFLNLLRSMKMLMNVVYQKLLMYSSVFSSSMVTLFLSWCWSRGPAERSFLKSIMWISPRHLRFDSGYECWHRSSRAMCVGCSRYRRLLMNSRAVWNEFSQVLE